MSDYEGKRDVEIITTMKDVTPIKTTVDSSKLPDMQPLFEEAPNVFLNPLELYLEIRKKLMEAQDIEEVKTIEENYKESAKTLNPDQKKDLTSVKESRLKLFAAPDLK